MIVGIGTDIVEISRIDRLLEKNPRFVDKVYSPAEID
ncbi:MAG: 4'-phosphopantetheinyl transferase superfamily protein, partial [Candidatus Cloacimonetes bacterium]|nr:4'-phosphopantetheinyl transferase superfamily protein [Candidatus Cloacimonadota bacterium]